MAVKFGNYSCIDPGHLADYCSRKGLPWDWKDRANTYFCPTIGAMPARGYILLTGASLKAIRDGDLRYGRNLQFFNPNGVRALPLKNIRITGTPLCITPANDAEADNAAFLCEVTDRRIDLMGDMNKVWNWRPYPDAPIAGTEANWEVILRDIWASLGIIDPYPATDLAIQKAVRDAGLGGIPWQIDGRGMRAVDLLEDLLYCLGLCLTYDPFFDKFSIADLTVQPTQINLYNDGDFKPIYSSNNFIGNDYSSPEYVRVAFPVWGPIQTLSPDNSYVICDIPNSRGALATSKVTGTYTVMQDILPARITELGGLVNTNELTTRATQVATQYLLRMENRTKIGPMYKTFSGFVANKAMLTNRGIDAFIFQDTAGEYSPSTTIIRLGSTNKEPLLKYGSASNLALAPKVSGEIVLDPKKVAGTDYDAVIRTAGVAPYIDAVLTSNLGGLFANRSQIYEISKGFSVGILFNRGPLRENDGLANALPNKYTHGRKMYYPRGFDNQSRIVRVTDVNLGFGSASGTGSASGSASGSAMRPGRYRGVEMYYDAPSNAWLDGNPCWVMELNGKPLTTRRYRAQRSDTAQGLSVYLVEDGFSSAITSGSASLSASLSGSAGGLATAYRTDCIGGILYRYISYHQIFNGILTQTPYAFDSTQGCCVCPGSGSGSGSGSTSGTGSGSGSTSGTSSSSGITNACCGSTAVPNTLTWVFSGASVGCTCLNGVTVTITWDGTNWTGSATICGATRTVSLACTGGVWTVTFADCVMGSNVPVVVCSPFQLNFTGLAIGSPCCSTAGTVDVTITA